MTRRVLITGANKGIGLATVRAILEGADDTHVLLGSRSAERGEEARETLPPELQRRVDVVAIDVSSDESVRSAADEVAAKGRLYGVINNAGVGEGPMRRVVDVNTRGPRRVCEAFLPLIDARIVNVSSGSGPSFVAGCSPEIRARLTSPDVTWDDVEDLLATCIAIEEHGGDFAAAGFGSGSAYGLSKACLNAYTIDLARRCPNLLVNACSPGFIETDMTRRYASSQGARPEDLGMKPPSHGAKTPAFLMLGDPGGTGWYFGSDQQRSPLDRYRSPGDPPYTGS